MKTYKVRLIEGLIDVPGKEVDFKGLPGRFIATRPIMERPAYITNNKHIQPITETLAYQTNFWTLTEFTTGLNILHIEEKTIKSLLDKVERRLTENEKQSFPRLLPKVIEKYGIANQ